MNLCECIQLFWLEKETVLGDQVKILYYQKGNVKLFNFTCHFAFDL